MVELICWGTQIKRSRGIYYELTYFELCGYWEVGLLITYTKSPNKCSVTHRVDSCNWIY